MNTYTYKIVDLQRNNEGIINFAAFTITASNGKEENTHLFHTAFTPPKGEAIPFANVTEEHVINWIKVMFDTVDDDGNHQNQNEEQADAELDALIARTQVHTGLPW